MNTYNILSNKIPAQILEVIARFQQILGEQDYDFLLEGASARDLIMNRIYELASAV